VTLREFFRLRPGHIIRRKKDRVLRVVVSETIDSAPRRMPVGLLKIGRSWTDPRPTAWYDANVILTGYLFTGRRALSERSARHLRNWSKSKKGKSFSS
jgi:hypothetical protein